MSQVEMSVPELGESVSEATVARWLVAEGEAVELDQIVCELDSDKASVEVPAEAAGVLVARLVSEGETVDVGSPLCRIDTAASPSAKAPESPRAEAETDKAKSSDSPHASPAAARLLREHDLSPADVSGSGRGGRITHADAQAAVASQSKAPDPAAPTPKAEQASAAESSPPSGPRREKMSSLRKTIARRLVAVKNETAMLTTFNEVDMSAVMALRSRYKTAFKERYDVNLGFMSFFTAASCQALQAFPAVNAQIEGDEVLYFDHCDIGVAVSSERGLVVPVVRGAEAMQLDEIEREILRLAKKARDNKISIEDLRGGTFTITNGGVFGSMLSTPIINAPQCAILGLHNIVERPVAIAGEVHIRPIMYLALSYDHRLIDGKEAVSFLVRVKELIEDPARLLLRI
ncbi:MAG: 2-oxoglutarate dehydrogenase complex dihydrolipoyllysine-residue succinyltransferase [Candidatus Sericytochromatia bacterium]|nr:2-oxoglutarate dehydrogenase complex dihydrolipoyllysine-residue succinyltransferase [Candidatus Sericytochromatia bacterium]